MNAIASLGSFGRACEGLSHELSFLHPVCASTAPSGAPASLFRSGLHPFSYSRFLPVTFRLESGLSSRLPRLLTPCLPLVVLPRSPHGATWVYGATLPPVPFMSAFTASKLSHVWARDTREEMPALKGGQGGGCPGHLSTLPSVAANGTCCQVLGPCRVWTHYLAFLRW